MVNYENGKIYKIVCNKTGILYVGSTCVGLSQRLVEHRASYNRFKNGKIINKSSSIKILEGGDYSIILLEICPCNNKEQLIMKEREWINKIECINVIKRPILLENELSANVIRYKTDEDYRQNILNKNKEWGKNTDQDKLREYTKLKMRRLREIKKICQSQTNT